MTTPLSYHPSLAELEALATRGDMHADTHAAAAHVRSCSACHDSLRRIERLSQILASGTAAESDARLSRIEARMTASLSGGVAVLLPTEPIELESTDDRTAVAIDEAREQSSLPQRKRRFARPAALAAALAGIAALAVLRPTQSAEAGMIAGSMTISPTLPKPGEAVTVRYTAGALFGRPGVLRLRARLRNATGESYNTGIPVVTLTTLQRERGGEYVAQFTLPDSIVFAALAVEDTGATAVDDYGGRTWEVLRGTDAGTPTFAALDQRAHDLMGRGWEEGLATVRRMVALYPDSVAAWSWLSAYEIWMSLATDSTRNVHRAQGVRLGALYTERGQLTPANLGRLFWYTRTLDDSRTQAWRTRLLSEAPTNEFAIQERLRDVAAAAIGNSDSLTALAVLDTLWREAPANRRDQVTDMALQLIPRSDRHAGLMQRWTARLTAQSPSIARERTAARLQLAVPSLREQAITQLTQLAARSVDSTRYIRGLDETADALRKRMLRAQALTDATLGQALTSAGRANDAMAVLRRAADAAWDPEVFNALASTSMSAGDTTYAMPYLGRVRVDPRTSTKRVAALDSLGRRVLGATRWADLLAAQRREMARRVMSDATPRLVDDVTVRRLDGTQSTLTQLAGGKPLMVVIWSPNCGPAVEALPDIAALSETLATRGMPVISIVEQPTRDSILDATMAKAKFTAPVYLDPAGKATAAFNNWGTPQIYLVDGRRRVQFAPTSDVDLARLRAEAMLNGTR